MTTASPKVAARRAHRTSDRDARVNGDLKPGTGLESNARPEAMLAVAQSGPSAGPGAALSDDLAQSFRAGTVPQVGPGQTQSRAGSAGERPQTGPTGQTQRGPDKGQFR